MRRTSHENPQRSAHAGRNGLVSERSVSMPEEFELDWDYVTGRGDPKNRYRIYRLCPGETEPELVATCETEGAVGVALCTLGREGEFDVVPEGSDCPVGVLDTMGEERKWLIRPWGPSPRQVSDAGRML